MATITTDASTQPHLGSSPEPTPLRRLRQVLATNAITSFAGGVVGLAAAGPLSEGLGIDHVALTRIISAGLVLFGIEVALLARSQAERTVRWAAVVSLLDFSWVLATVAVLAAGILTTSGVIVGLVIGISVLDFGILQLWFSRRAQA